TVFAVLMVYSLQMFGQNTAFDEAFQKYAMKEGFVTINLSGEVFNMFFCNDHKKGELKIGNVKIISAEDESIAKGIDFYNEIIPKLNMDDYLRLMDLKSAGEQMVILQKKVKNETKEFLIVSGGKENFMLYIEGSLNFDDVKKISEEMGSGDLSFN
ncbi:MAG: DUF4252 domain-containing protein, partial [Bacteroidales bacterium]|nr:DUF4252 domain-containing protein [Bacteroidales bacterium]